MSFTKKQIREINLIRRELLTVPDLITRNEAHRLCITYGVKSPKFQKGEPSTPFRLLDVIVYIAKRV
jgi:hypothetical protein